MPKSTLKWRYINLTLTLQYSISSITITTTMTSFKTEDKLRH